MSLSPCPSAVSSSNAAFQDAAPRVSTFEQAEEFGQIETTPFGEYGGLPERQDRRRDDHLVARLRHLARTEGTEMNRVAARGEHRPRVRDITFLTTDHDRQRAGFGTFDAAGDRCVDNPHGAGRGPGQPRAQLPDPDRRRR
jgi:hypothetical protein